MRKTNAGLLILSLGILVLSGWGCAQSTQVAKTSPIVITSGPQPLQVAGLSADDLTKKINLTEASVIVLDQKFSGKAEEQAKAMHIGGKDSERTVVIKSFAPGHLAEVEWKLDYKDDRGTNQQFVGALAGTNLAASRELYLPALWPEGVRNAYGTGLLWVSADAYENLSKNGLSTFDFGLTNETLVDNAATSTGAQAALYKLQQAIDKLPKNIDVKLMKTSTSTAEFPLKVNGTDAKVKVYQAKGWFGEMDFLANPQNPLVLKVKMNDLPDGSPLNGVLDYEVTQIHDLQE